MDTDVPCSVCGLGSDSCACEHDWKPPVPYVNLGYTLVGLVICGRCGVSQTLPWNGPQVAGLQGTYSPWDGYSSCPVIRKNRIAANEQAAMAALIREAERKEFLASHSEGHYWVTLRNREIQSEPCRHPFVSYLNPDGFFSVWPGTDEIDDSRCYWRDVEILCKCEIPDCVQARIDAEFVMYS